MTDRSAPPTAAAGYIDPDVAAQLAAKCPVVGEIGSYFLIPTGSSLQSVFPNGGKTPELDGRDGLFVAVYAGDVRLPTVTGGGTTEPGSSPRPSTFSNVVCVVPPTGEVEVYSDVSKQGMALPPGAHTGPPPTVAPSSTAIVMPSPSVVLPTGPPSPTSFVNVPTPAPQPTPARSPAAVSLNWSRLDQSEWPDVGAIYEVVPGQNRFLANASGGLMASPDGMHWSVIGSAPGRVYDDARGLFAFGSEQTTQGSKTELFSSADGSSWKSLTDQQAFTSGPCVSAGNPIGGIYPIGNSLIAVGSAAALSSEDGQTWQCLGPIPNLRINGGHSLLVGSGSTDPQSPIEYLWLSHDGATWHATTETADFMNPAPVADGFVALGQSYNSAPAVLLTSADGEHWTPQPVAFGSEILNESAPLASDGSRAVVVEDAPDFTAESPGDVWVSSKDGSTWTRYPLPRHRSDYAISSAILGNQIVVFGEDEGQGNAALIWTATIP